VLGGLVLVFILVPLIDLAALIRVGGVLGFWPTVLVVVLTGLVGAALAKHQGLRTLAKINAELSAGRVPTSQLADGMLILLAGAVLITPGFLTDLFGLLLLVPPFRRVIKRVVLRYCKTRLVVTDGGSISEAPVDGFDGPMDVGRDMGPRPMKHVENESLRK
jgi:UPF0716 protein FxsA